MFSISKKHAIKDYERLKEAAFKACALRQYSKSLQLIACAAGQAYHLNFRYADDALEGLLEKISTEVLGQSLELPQEENPALLSTGNIVTVHSVHSNVISFLVKI